MFHFLAPITFLALIISGETYAQIGPDWCTHASAQRLNADLNNDGRMDAVCHDRQTGTKWVAIRDGSRLIERWVDDTKRWCSHANASLFIGDVDGDGRADLICKDPEGIWVDYMEDDFYQGTEFVLETTWCTHSGAVMSVSDQNFDKRADLVCTNADGSVFVDLADEFGHFSRTDFSGTCTTRNVPPAFSLVDRPRDGAFALRTGEMTVSTTAIGADDETKQTFLGTTGFSNAPQMGVRVQAIPRVNSGQVRFTAVPPAWVRTGVAVKLVVSDSSGRELCSDEQVLQNQEGPGLSAEPPLDRARTLSCNARISGNYQARVYLRAWSTAVLAANSSADADVTLTGFSLRECRSM